MKKLLILIAIFLISVSSYCQEMDCQVSVTAPTITGTDKKVFETLQSAMYEFINNHKWSNFNLKSEERIECTILLTVSDRLSVDEF